MDSIKGFLELTEEQQELFISTHKTHLSILGIDTKKKYMYENIKKVEWSKEEKCIKVFYDNGDWYHYEDTNWY
jgi:hypothetical protein